MTERHFPSRRELTRRPLLAMLALAGIVMVGCGGSTVDLGPSPPAGSREGVVSANHGHRAIVEAAQLNSSSTVTIDMRFRATHNHTLMLSPNELAAIVENGRVVKTSSTTDGHSHSVTFN